MTVAPAGADWAGSFHNFGLLHGLTTGSLIAAMIAAVILGRIWRGTRREQILRYAWAWFTIVWQVAAQTWWLLPANFNLYESLPLHLCDLAAWVAPLALLTQKRWLRALLFFWGLGLSTQAFVSPVVDQGVARVEFWLFWIGHTQIVGSAAYDAAVLGFRPRLRDFLITVFVSLGFVCAMLAFNLALDTNYWFVGRSKPSAPTVVDLLGAWPWRVVWMAVLGTAVFALLWGLFAAAERVAKPRHGA